MPWKECSVMDERLQFVARRLAGEAMAELCREFGISRKTGYKIFDRYQECGVQGLTDRSRRPYRYAHRLPAMEGRDVLWEANELLIVVSRLPYVSRAMITALCGSSYPWSAWGWRSWCTP